MTDYAGVTLIDPNQTGKTVTMNQAISDTIDKGSALLAVAMADANQTLSSANALKHGFFDCTGALTANRNLVLPNDVKFYTVRNSTTGAHSIVVKTSGGTGITVASGKVQLLYCDGTNVVAVAAAV